MTHSTTRREVLVAMAGTAAIPSVLTARPAAAQEACDELMALKAEVEALGDRLEVGRADLDRLPGLLVERQREILELHAAMSEPRFPSDVKAQANDVGLDARSSVTVLDVDGRNSQGTATAWFVSDHYLLTNAHNVEGEIETLYGITLQGETFEADLVDRVGSEQPDVALLRTDFTGLPLSVGESHSLSSGEPLVQVGHPGVEAFGFWAITMGTFLARSSSNSLSATIPGLTGSSGSPILNLNGEVVAMTYGAAAEDSNAVGPTDDEVRVGLLAGEPSTSAVPIEAAIDRMEAWT